MIPLTIRYTITLKCLKQSGLIFPLLNEKYERPEEDYYEYLSLSVLLEEKSRRHHEKRQFCVVCTILDLFRKSVKTNASILFVLSAPSHY